MSEVESNTSQASSQSKKGAEGEDPSKPQRLRVPNLGAGAPNHVRAIHKSSTQALLQLLSNMFDNSDDALFERADRSQNNRDQQMYFESMRELRLQRAAITKTFADNVTANFTKLLEKPKAPKTEEEITDFDAVSLLDQDELEISVAIAGIVSKVTSQHSITIMQLTKRLDHLVRQQDVTEKNNPLGPQRLGEAFADALSVLQVDITIRIILMKLFERFVMEQLAEMYAQANKQLREAGVLPDLKNTVQTSRAANPGVAAAATAANVAVPSQHLPSQPVGAAGPAIQPAGASPYPGGASGGASGGAYVGGAGSMAMGGYAAGFGTIQSLMSDARLPATQGGTVISTDQLLSVLSNLQSQTTASAGPSDTTPAPVDLRKLVSGQAADLTGGKSAGLRQSDDDLVNFVGMLFDYILNDRNLAIPMKALIARLQIPIVKLSIMDKSFFENVKHPARRLLNELSSAGIGWSSAAELKRDALYNKIESVVVTVLSEFQTNPDIFEQLLGELTDFVHRDQHKSDVVEQRLKETEHGKARTQEAKQRAQSIINQKACGLRLHPTMGRFISDVWSKVLVFVCIKHGDDADEWSDAVAVLDDLLWSIQPLNELEDVDRRDTQRPELVERLAWGMRLISLSEQDLAEHCSDIDAHLQEISEHDRAYLQSDDQDSEPVPEPELEQLGEIVLTHPVLDAADTDGVVPDPEHLETVEKLAEGAWLELKGSDGLSQRCKLATIIGDGVRFIFVNRKGMKVAERSRLQLAGELGNGRATLLDDSEVFDRALEAVIGNLREMRAAPNA